MEIIMKTAAIALSVAIGLASPASAQNFRCTYASGTTFCNGAAGNYSAQTFGDSFARGYLGGLNIASQYAMVNAYREAHGLPRCHYGLLGAIMSASDGRPMC
jgi:hypothetical protein